VEKPTFTEVDATITKVFPNMARLRNLSYSANLHCRLEWKTLMKGKAETIHTDESNRYRFLGCVPVMVMSDNCRIKTDLSCKEDFERNGECSSDPGGYFIVRGKERVSRISIATSYNLLLTV
jgi:DNA-directed RNA polymerase beta subunit